MDKVSRAVEGGANIVQLREKGLTAIHLMELAQRLQSVTRGAALLFINDRVDVAMASGADGVQLGEDGLSVEEARQVGGDDLLIGRSVHSLKGAMEAHKQGADLLVAGSMFSTGSHLGLPPNGPRLVSEIAARVDVPVLGIGGVNARNAGDVMHSGASGVAVIRAVLAAPDVRLAAQEIREAIEAAWEGVQPERLVGTDVTKE